ncbi:chemotaxis protein CheW [Caldicellulosiruptoraceae bacterium PP1]
MNKDKDKNNMIVSFKLGQQTIGISINNVKEIIRVPEITPVPLTVSYFAGLINLRGDIIPVIDLKEKYKIDSIGATEDRRIIVIEENMKKFGIIVDKVLDITEYDEEDIDKKKIGSYEEIEAIIKQESKHRIVVLIDIAKVVSENIILFNYSNKKESKTQHSKELKNNISESESRFILFEICEQNYALEIEKIKEIMRYTELSEIPDNENNIDGVINLRGEVIPIINLSKIIGLQNIPITDATRIIILMESDYKVGFIVDKVNAVLSVAKSDIKEPSFLISSKEIIKNIINAKDCLAMVLNTSKILSGFEEKIRSDYNTGDEFIGMDSKNDEMQVVIFETDNQLMALNITDVKEINKVPNIVPLPQEREYIKGIANLRGEIIPIFDLDKLFYQTQTTINDSSRIIIVEIGNKKYGIIAKKVLSVSSFGDKDIIELDNEENQINVDIEKRYIKSVLKKDEQVVIVLNTSSIIHQ